MRLRLDDLGSHLAGGPLAGVYLISGDEPLQLLEACDAVRAAAKRQGIDERIVLAHEARFDWSRLDAESDAMSLFSSRRLIELHLGDSKPGRDGAKALTDYAQTRASQDVLLLSLGKLDKRALASAWVKAVDAAGVLVQVRPVTPAQLPGWLQRRAQALGLELSAPACALIAEHAEGNLLAAAQELEKLRLLVPEGRVELEQALNATADSARFNVFELADTALAGATGRCVRILRGLRTEGVEPPAISWLLARELRTLVNIADACQAGAKPARVMERLGVWRQRQSQFRAALERHSRARLHRLLRQAMRLDRTVKGATGGDPWEELTWLCCALAGGGFDAVQRSLLS